MEPDTPTSDSKPLDPVPIEPATQNEPTPLGEHMVTFIKNDQDYVATFRQVTRVNLMIEKRGATPKRLLWRSNLHYAMGDFERSAQDAAELLHTDPDNAEGYYRIATASLAIAIGQLNRRANAPARPRNHHHNTPREHLIVAQMALRKVCKLNPEDEEARQALKTSRWLLDSLPELEPEGSLHPAQGCTPT